MKKAVILLVLALLIHNYAVHSTQQDEIDELFGSEEEADVIVVLNDDYNVLQEYGISSYKYKDDFEKEKMMIQEQQEHVLDNLRLKKKGQNAKINAQDEDYDFDLRNAYSTVNGFHGKLKKSAYNKLKNNPKVKMIYKPKAVSLFLNDAKGIVNATNAWRLVYNGQNITGKGETVCVIDTGVDYTHPALGGCTSAQFTTGTCQKVIGGYDYVNSDNNPIDDQGHGTHVTGIIASANATYTGIAPEANIVALKVLDSSGSGTSANVINGIDWCVNNASKFNISVISMSLGTSALYSAYCDNDDLLTAASINAATAKNISVIAAAGNDGNTSKIASPACIANATSVGSSTKADGFSSFTNRNNITDLFAPGSSITSSLASIEGGNFGSKSGTSMATPVVSGVFALLRQFKRQESNIILTPSQIQQKLNDTGKLIVDSGGSGLQFSRINVYSALLALDTTAPTINFSAPTESNNTRIFVNFTFINISSNEVLLNATLEWNGTNETMEGSGLNWWKNKSFAISSVPFTFRVWGNDSAGNIGVSELRTLIFNNTAPKIDSFRPETLVFSIAEPNNQTFNITAHDNEGNALTFNWYKNSTLAASNSNFTFFGNYTTAGFYNITIIISDSDLSAVKQWNFSVNNTNRGVNITSFTPAASNFTISEPSSQDFNITYSDFDADDTINVTWYTNGTITATNSNYTFSGNYSSAGFYNITVVASDLYSQTTTQWNMTILNTNRAPNITSFSPNELVLNIAELTNQIFNITISDLDNDNLTISWFQNATGKSTLTGLISQSNFTFSANSTSAGFHNITVIISDNITTTSQSWNLTIYNPAPTITSANLTNKDFLNRTNGTLQAFFSFSDFDDDAITLNETKWYNNSIEVIEFSNFTIVTSNYTLKNQNWTFSARIFDGFNWSDWVNSTILSIKNAVPVLATIPNISVNETDLVDINDTGSVSAADLDGDNIIFAYTSPLNSTGKWQTTTKDARNYTITINATDNDGGLDSRNAIIAVLDKNTGENDTLIGNLSDIKTNIPNLTLKLNGTIFNSNSTIVGIYPINFSDAENTLVTFDFNFTNSSKFNFVDIKINKTKIDGAESLVVKGIDLSSQNRKKIAYLNRTNITFNSVCVKDAEMNSIEEMTSGCSAGDETKLPCDGVETSGFACTLEATTYKITGLSHSGIKQISYDRPSSGSSSSSSSSSSGGGGGGGGGSPFYICNMDWKCEEWTPCANARQVRACNFVKVPQHSQPTPCPSSDKPPEASRACAEEKMEAIKNETCSDGIKNQNEEEIDCGGVCKSCAKNATIMASSRNETESGITGSAVERTKLPPMAKLTIIIVAVMFPLAAYGYYRWRKRIGKVK